MSLSQISKIKILHITPHLGGGVGKVLLNYISEAKKNKRYHFKIALLEYANDNAKSVSKKINLDLFDKMSDKKDELLEMIIKSDIIL